jgi:uncharacterized protein (DUF58 family)
LYFKAKKPGTSIRSALHFLNNVATRKTVTFLISDFIDHNYETALAVSAKRHDLISVQIRDPRESSLVPAGVVEWEDAESGRRVLIDTSDAATRRAFDQQVAQRQAYLRDLLRKRGIDVIELTTNQPYARELVRFFRKRGRRR